MVLSSPALNTLRAFGLLFSPRHGAPVPSTARLLSRPSKKEAGVGTVPPLFAKAVPIAVLVARDAGGDGLRVFVPSDNSPSPRPSCTAALSPYVGGNVARPAPVCRDGVA